jgi:hypothetical protein
MEGVRALILREVGVLALWRLRGASMACKEWAEEALAELPKLVTLTERRRPLTARARALPMGLEEEEEEDEGREGEDRRGGGRRESSGGGWELQLRPSTSNPLLLVMYRAIFDIACDRRRDELA